MENQVALQNNELSTPLMMNQEDRLQINIDASNNHTQAVVPYFNDKWH